MKRARRLGALGAALILLLLTGCGGEGDPAPAGPESSAADATSGSASPEPSESSGSSAGAGASESVDAASGRPMTVESAYARAPEGWRIKRQLPGVLDSWLANEKGTVNQIYLSDLGTVSSPNLRAFVRTSGLKNFSGRPRVSYDAELGGEEAFHATGPGVLGPRQEYGALRGGSAVVIAFEFTSSMPAREQERIIDEVMASFRWS